MQGDACTWRPAAPVDAVFFSYALTMIPDWFRAVDNAIEHAAAGRAAGRGGLLCVTPRTCTRPGAPRALRRGSGHSGLHTMACSCARSSALSDGACECMHLEEPSEPCPICLVCACPTTLRRSREESGISSERFRAGAGRGRSRASGCTMNRSSRRSGASAGTSLCNSSRLPARVSSDMPHVRSIFLSDIHLGHARLPGPAAARLPARIRVRPPVPGRRHRRLLGHEPRRLLVGGAEHGGAEGAEARAARGASGARAGQSRRGAARVRGHLLRRYSRGARIRAHRSRRQALRAAAWRRVRPGHALPPLGGGTRRPRLQRAGTPQPAAVAGSAARSASPATGRWPATRSAR